MKRLVVFMIGLAFIFTASASAQPQTAPKTKDAAPDKVQLGPGGVKEKKDAKETKMTKKTKKEQQDITGTAGVVPVVR